ncbi:MAG: HAD family hydrolase [Candidatus Eutrophobiaceae bacterium]
MKKLAVFDLDGTLFMGDSFRLLIRESALRGNMKLLFLVLRRGLRCMEADSFAERAHEALLGELGERAFLEHFVSRLRAKLNMSVRASAQFHRERGCTTILLSASPHEYVSPLGKAECFDFSYGSAWHENQYRRLHGIRKKEFLDMRFPVQKWQRFYAVADSPSDFALLRDFENVDFLGVSGSWP